MMMMEPDAGVLCRIEIERGRLNHGIQYKNGTRGCRL
jgi:hypothetical protein